MDRGGRCFHPWHREWTRCCVSLYSVHPKVEGEGRTRVTCFRIVATDATWSSRGFCCMVCRLVRVDHKQHPPSLNLLQAYDRTRFRPIPGSDHAFAGHCFVEAAAQLEGRAPGIAGVLSSSRGSRLMRYASCFGDMIRFVHLVQSALGGVKLQ